MRITFYIIFFIVLFKIKSANTPEYLNIWVVWNVGQGQWVSHILSDECFHYDMGGEFGSFKNIKKKLLHLCGTKINKLNLSHWDYDHFANIPSLSQTLPKICWQNKPEFGKTKKAVQKILNLNIPDCHQLDANLKIWKPLTAQNTNESSMIFYTDRVLITGDSPIKNEKIWAYELSPILSTRVLILGHHGSRTSTGDILLSKLNNLNYSIASARYLKYKHPHQDTLSRLSKYQIPVLKTEDWGNIWFE